MKLIVGLGNPGIEYQETRHNVGFMVVDKIINKIDSSFVEDRKNKCLIYKNEDFILIKPQTFMNLSGDAVSSIMKFYKISAKDLLVICDELDIEVGKAKIKLSSSSGGHNGIKDIIGKIGTSDFYRLKIGIGRPIKDEKISHYVLNQFDNVQKTKIDLVIAKAAEVVMTYIYNDINYVVNNFNKKGK